MTKDIHSQRLRGGLTEDSALKVPTVKEQIQLHLFDFNRFQDEYETPLEVTQEGIARAVGINVHHVTQYVRPLLSEEMLQERTPHSRGKAEAKGLLSDPLRKHLPSSSTSGSKPSSPLR